MLRAVLFVCLAAGLAHGQTNATPAQASPSPAQLDQNYVPDVARQAAAEGNAAFLKKDYDHARVAYKKVLDLVPNNLLGLINLGVVEYSAGHHAEAEALLKRAVQLKLN